MCHFFSTQIADGTTLLSLHESNVISLPTSEESEQLDAQRVSELKDEHASVESDSEIKGGSKPVTHGEIGSELIGSFLNSENAGCNIIKNKDDEFGAKKPDDFTTYIRTLLTQSQDGVTDSSLQEETDEPVTETAVRTEVRPPARILPQVALHFICSIKKYIRI